MLKKRAQGLSITTVVVAVMALIVIVILIGIFKGGIDTFSPGVESLGDATITCTANGGTPTDDDECGEGKSSIVSSDAAGRGQRCCK